MGVCSGKISFIYWFTGDRNWKFTMENDVQMVSNLDIMWIYWGYNGNKLWDMYTKNDQIGSWDGYLPIKDIRIHNKS